MFTSETRIPLLSKSRFIAGLQCGLRLWHECYNPDLASEISRAQQAIFDMGHEVGELATRLYPGGIIIKEDHLHHEEGVQSSGFGNDRLVPHEERKGGSQGRECGSTICP